MPEHPPRCSNFLKTTRDLVFAAILAKLNFNSLNHEKFFALIA